MNILQKIFKEHYEEIIYILHPRQAIVENIDRMINCGDPSFGGAMYGCTECGNLKFVPFRCHIRFCPSCGTKYSIDRTTNMSFKWRNSIAYSFGYDPLKCSCGNQMSLLELFQNHKPVPLDDLYRKAVEKLRLLISS